MVLTIVLGIILTVIIIAITPFICLGIRHGIEYILWLITFGKYRIGGIRRNMSEKYKKYEYCKAIGCSGIEHSDKCCISGCLYTAKNFHKWLKENNFKIVKENK